MSDPQQIRKGVRAAEKRIGLALVTNPLVQEEMARGLNGPAHVTKLLDLDILDQAFGDITDLTSEEEWVALSTHERRSFRHMLVHDIIERHEHSGDNGGELILPEPLESNIAKFRKAFDLGDLDVRLFKLIFLGGLSANVLEFLEYAWKRSPYSRDGFVAAATQMESGDVTRLLQPSAPLVENGWLEVDDENVMISMYGPRVPKPLVKHLVNPDFSIHSFLDDIAPRAEPPTLALSDYEHMKKDVDYILRALRGAQANPIERLNILLRGLPGTGKSELARVLGHELGLSVRLVGACDKDGEAPSPWERLRSLTWTLRLMPKVGAFLPIFEEADELLELRQSENSRPISKFYLNRILESSMVPIVFCTNSVRYVDSAVLSRMRYDVVFKTPSKKWREKILVRHTQDVSGLNEDAISLLARKYPVTPRLLAGAVTTAVLASGGSTVRVEDVDHALESTARLQGIRPVRVSQPRHNAAYDLAFSNTDRNLAEIVSSLEGWDETKGCFSILLYGVPGTGKSVFARHLADAIGREVVVKRASDILDKFLGGTEENISAAFQEAREENSVLLIDEVDFLLRDRREAANHWEISQTEEFLVQLDDHDGIVVCTTNLREKLDPAAVSRFIEEVKFDWMRSEQVVGLFKETYRKLAGNAAARLSETTAFALTRMDNVAPRDIANAARRLGIRGGDISAEHLLEELRADVSHKEGARNPIGFCT